MKELGMETCPGEAVVKEEKFPHSRKPSHRWVCGKFWNLRRQHNRGWWVGGHRIHAKLQLQERELSLKRL